MLANTNKRAQGLEYDNMFKIVLWIIFILLAGTALYFILKKITG